MRKLVGIFAGGCGLAYGSYYISQAGEISKYAKEEGDLQRLVEKETRTFQTLSKTLTEEEMRMKMLSEQVPSVQKAVEAAEEEVEAARQRLNQLEQAYKSKQEAAAKVSSELESVGSKIGALKRDADRAAHAQTLGQKSLVLAHQQAIDSKKLLNPLNHPKVLAMLGKK